MPKRIPHLAESILSQAGFLFSRLGYDAVDMKMVAAEAGTSVGNLYNYFPSKPALFLAIKDRWRKDLLDTCHELIQSDLPRRERILAVLHRLYDDITRWRGIWLEFLRGRDERSHFAEAKAARPKAHFGFGPEETAFLAEFEALLLQKDPGTGQRWATLLMTATVQVAVRYPDDSEANWQFLETLVDKI